MATTKAKVSIKKIRVMISSRCNDPISYKGVPGTLTDVRKEIKRILETSKFLEHQLLEVWINELAPAEEGTKDSWDLCLQQIDDADIVIVLYNGDAGWTDLPNGIGICHAELDRALSIAPAKVRLIALDLTPKTKPKDDEFRSYVAKRNLFRGGRTASTGEEVINITKETVAAALTEQVRLGLREAKKGTYHLGAALDWTRLDFGSRKVAIENTVSRTLGAKSGDRLITHKIQGNDIVFSIHGIPDSFSTSEARELVGRPFLEDYKTLTEPQLKKAKSHGPIHIIGVHKSMTESQAQNYIGHPNIILVNAPFGYYLADRIDHSQTIILTQCRDETSTKHAVQRCLDWLEQSGEAALIADRATRRKLILAEIAKQIMLPV